MHTRYHGLIKIAYIVCLTYEMLFIFLYRISGWPYITVIIMEVIMLTIFIANREFRMMKRHIILILTILVFFLISFIFIKSEFTTKYFISFLTIGIYGIFISQYKLSEADIYNIIKSVAVITGIYLILGGGWKDLKNDSFTVAPSILPGLISSLVLGLINIRKHSSGKGIFYFFLFSIIGFPFLKLSARGSIVCFLSVIILLMIIQNTSRLLKCFAVFFVGAGMVLLTKIEIIILLVYSWLEKMGIELYFITKSVIKLKYSNLSSHRDVLVKDFFDMDIKQIFLGRGIGGYEKAYGNYVHNIVLNLWSDYGVLAIIFLIIVSVYGYKVIKSLGLKKYLYVLLIGIGFFPLLFSFTYWRIPSVFLLLGLILSEKPIKERE